jgi:hypothetical protein
VLVTDAEGDTGQVHIHMQQLGIPWLTMSLSFLPPSCTNTALHVHAFFLQDPTEKVTQELVILSVNRSQ